MVVARHFCMKILGKPHQFLDIPSPVSLNKKKVIIIIQPFKEYTVCHFNLLNQLIAADKI